jgi:uncharacterized membrane protein YhfC
MDVLARGAAGLLMVALSLALGVYLVRRFRVGWRLLLIGSATFIGAQVLHIPFNNYVLNPMLAQLGFAGTSPSGAPLAAAAILLGLSAGVFEEGARWLVYRFWIRKARTWEEGVVFGAGHGGAEAVIFGLLGLATLVQMLALRGQDLSTIVPPEQLEIAEAQVQAFWSLPAWAAFLAPLERASALAIQISLSVIVLQAFLRPRGFLWLAAAILWHALIDAAAVYAGVTTGVYGGATSGMLLTEGLVLVLALLSLAILFRLRPVEDSNDAVAPPSPPHAGPVPGRPEGPDRLNDSRFSNKG